MDFIQRTCELARENVEQGGRPFACLIVKDGEVIAEGTNQVVQTKDPTAHAEIVAIRAATRRLGTEDLSGCVFYILAHPCPMCLGAMYYCNPEKVVFITTREDYARYYTDDRRYFTFENFYDEFAKPWSERNLPMEHHPREQGIAVYRQWAELNQR